LVIEDSFLKILSRMLMFDLQGDTVFSEASPEKKADQETLRLLKFGIKGFAPV